MSVKLQAVQYIGNDLGLWLHYGCFRNRGSPLLEVPLHTPYNIMGFISNIMIITQVFTRLNKLGLSVSHISATRMVQNMGNRYDQPARDWKDALSIPDVLECSEAQHILVRGNFNKEINPRHKTADH